LGNTKEKEKLIRFIFTNLSLFFLFISVFPLLHSTNCIGVPKQNTYIYLYNIHRRQKCEQERGGFGAGFTVASDKVMNLNRIKDFGGKKSI
jgi:hypothetical protein